MATCARLAPVLLIALLGHMSSPGRPPGSPPGESPLARTVKCPNPECDRGRGRWSPEEGKYICDSCDNSIGYCRPCRSLFLDEEAKRHRNHSSG